MTKLISRLNVMKYKRNITLNDIQQHYIPQRGYSINIFGKINGSKFLLTFLQANKKIKSFRTHRTMNEKGEGSEYFYLTCKYLHKKKLFSF